MQPAKQAPWNTAHATHLRRGGGVWELNVCQDASLGPAHRHQLLDKPGQGEAGTRGGASNVPGGIQQDGSGNDPHKGAGRHGQKSNRKTPSLLHPSRALAQRPQHALGVAHRPHTLDNTSAHPKAPNTVLRRSRFTICTRSGCKAGRGEVAREGGAQSRGVARRGLDAPSAHRTMRRVEGESTAEH